MNTDRIIRSLIALNFALIVVCLVLAGTVVFLAVRTTPATSREIVMIPTTSPDSRGLAQSKAASDAKSISADSTMPIPVAAQRSAPDVASIVQTDAPARRGPSFLPAAVANSAVAAPASAIDLIPETSSSVSPRSDQYVADRASRPVGQTRSVASGVVGAIPARVAVNAAPVSSGGSGQAASTSTASAVDAPVAVPEGTISVPASLENTSPDLTLTDLQQKAKDRLANDFVDQLENTTSDPSNPDPVAWKHAQHQNDELFYTLFGHDAFLAQQFETNAENADSLNQ